MIRNLVIGAWLVVVWVALWGEITAANLGSGVLVAGFALTVLPMPPPRGRGVVRPLAALRFCGFFLKALVTANLEVAWEVVTPRNRDNEGIVALPIVPSCSDTVLMIIVNAIGLTPGTMVIDIAPDQRTCYVHVLHLDDLDASRALLFRFEELAVRGFGSDEARAELEALLASRPEGAH